MASKPKKVQTLPPSPPERESLGISPAVLAKRSTYIPEPWGPHLDPIMLHYDPWCDPYKPKAIHYKDALKAYRVIKEQIPTTPLTKANGSADFGVNLYLKAEFVHRSGSFHDRSAIYALHMLTDEQRKNGIYTSSLGNWGMALAYQANKVNVPVTIYLPTSAKSACEVFCQKYNATVVRNCETITECRELALTTMQEKTGATDCYINGYDHPHVIAAAGSIAFEILEQLPDVDAVIMAVGGGALIGGIATVMKKLKPSVLVYGVELQRACCFTKSLRQGKPYTSSQRWSCIQTPGYNAIHIALQLLDRMVLVDDDSIARSILYCVEEERFIIEQRCAGALAALYEEPNVVPELRNKNVVCIISGSAMDHSLFPRALDRARVVEGRLIIIKLSLLVGRSDELEKALKIISHLRCSIIDHTMEHICFKAKNIGKYQVVFACETRGVVHACIVKRALEILYPGNVRFSGDTYFHHTTCPCYPKMWPDL